MGRYLTVAQIVKQTAINLGLPTVDDPVASTDPLQVQLVGLLTEAGLDIVLKHEWPQLVAEKVLTTVAGQVDYTLPDDFLHIIPQSGWNRTTRFPLGGPLSVQEWQYLKAAVVGVTFNVLFRVTPTLMRLFPTPPNNFTIAYEYQSRNWLSSAGVPAGSTVPLTGTTLVDLSPPQPTVYLATDMTSFAQRVQHVGSLVSIKIGSDGDTLQETIAGRLYGNIDPSTGIPTTWVELNTAFPIDNQHQTYTSNFHAAGTNVELSISIEETVSTGLPELDAPASSGDVVLLEPVLVMKALKLRFLQTKGFDTSIQQDEYDKTLIMIAGRSDGAPRLSLNGNRIRDRFLDGLNIPITGMGGQGFGG
jgi:hypothetical protein